MALAIPIPMMHRRGQESCSRGGGEGQGGASLLWLPMPGNQPCYPSWARLAAEIGPFPTIRTFHKELIPFSLYFRCDFFDPRSPFQGHSFVEQFTTLEAHCLPFNMLTKRHLALSTNDPLKCLCFAHHQRSLPCDRIRSFLSKRQPLLASSFPGNVH